MREYGNAIILRPASQKTGEIEVQATGGDDNFASKRRARLSSCNKAALTVTANNQTITYGAAVPTLTATISGFVNGDTSSVVSGSATSTTNATTSNGIPNAGVWTITPVAGTLAASNYIFSFVPGTLRINGGTIIVAACSRGSGCGFG